MKLARNNIFNIRYFTHCIEYFNIYIYDYYIHIYMISMIVYMYGRYFEESLTVYSVRHYN
jgi:hypothetical protein